MLEIRNLTKSFGKNYLFRDLSVSIPKGAVALLGPNGAGKTTFLRCLLELYPTERGQFLWEGIPVEKTGFMSGHTGYLPQSFGAFPNLTCWEMMEYIAVLKGLPPKVREKEIPRCLALVNLSDKHKCLCRSLSGGMIRRLGIAQTLLGDPEILLFDEPTTGLDPEERLRFKLLVHQLRDEHTILISTHIVDDVEALCNHVTVMDKGCILANRTAGEMARRAEGLVWAVPASQKSSLPADSYIRGIGETPEGAVLYVLSEAELGIPLTPTIEDGYLCCLKGIGSW